MIIRRTPQDFLVREELRPELIAGLHSEWSNEARVGLWSLRKVSLTTPEATARLAKALGVKPGAVMHLGLKDKHAVTEQHVCAQHPNAPAHTAISAPGIDASLRGFLTQPATAADIAVNHFTIVVRDLSRAESDELDQRASLLSLADGSGTDAPGLLVLNFFGQQRFGSARHHQGFAVRPMLAGNYADGLRLLIGTPARKDTGAKRAFTRACAAHWGDWAALLEKTPRCPERSAIEELARTGDARAAFATLPMFLQQMCVDAFQSHLWNQAALHVAAGLSRAHAHTPLDSSQSTSLADLVLPAEHVPSEMRTAHLPMHAPGVTPPPSVSDAWHAALRSVELTPDQLTLPGLRRPAFGSWNRPLFTIARSFHAGPHEPDELGRPTHRKRTLTFALQSGSYATVVLEALGNDAG